MGYKQTSEHRFGKGSYHQIGLVRGQFGNVPMDKWLQFIKETGFDGWEEASWELDLNRCATDAGAEAYAKERVELAAFVGSPAHCWSHFFLFPPLPNSLEGHPIPDVRQVSLELLVERFGPFWDVCKKLGVTFDLECHPSERAMGDIESANDYLN